MSQIRTCVLGGNEIIEKYDSGAMKGYDQLLRLKHVDAPNWPSTGGAFIHHEWTYDSRSNRREWFVDVWGNKFDAGYSSASHQPDRLQYVIANRANTRIASLYEYDRDGRVRRKRGHSELDGGAGNWVLDFEYAPTAGSAGAESVFRAVNVTGNANPSWYNYYYDAFSRRAKKAYPTGIEDKYFYDNGHQLLEDRGNNASSNPTEYPLDEYVWLDGRPVAMVRSKLNSAMARQPDDSGTCARLGDAASCGLYFVVTDHIGKPVLILDSSRRIAGVGEYDPFGRLNRRPYWSETAHPYPANQNYTMATLVQPQNGLELDARVHFNHLDTETCSGTPLDFAYITGNSGQTFQTQIGRYHSGNLWSNWLPGGNSATFNVRFYSDGLNWTPDEMGGCLGPWTHPYDGVAFDEYQYRRYQGVSRSQSSSPSWKWSTVFQPGWEQPGFDDSGWASSVSEGGYGGWPWGYATAFPDGTPAQWIWHWDSRDCDSWGICDFDTVYFRKTFTATGSLARFTIAADNDFTAYLNGTPVASGNNWEKPVQVVTALTPGQSYVLAVRVTNWGGPGGLLAEVNETASRLFPPLRFPGHYYDPGIGRYLQPDPLMSRGPFPFTAAAMSGVNWPTYGYALNNPISNSDPDGNYVPGLQCISVALAEARSEYEANRGAMSRPGGDKLLHWVAACQMLKHCGPGAGVLAGALKEILDKLGLGSIYDPEDLGANLKGEICGLKRMTPPMCPANPMKCFDCCAGSVKPGEG